MFHSILAPKLRRAKVWLLLTLLSFSALSPRPAYALFGVGDVVHDPLLMAGMFGQTGAQIAQLVQAYMMLVDIKNRYGSLTKLKTWKAIARSYCMRSLQNLARAMIYDIQKRGARITAETPTNPVLSSMISGRQKLQSMENAFNRADALSTSYSKSDWSIAKMDEEARRRDLESRMDQQAANSDSTDGPAVAVATTPDAYTTRPNEDANNWQPTQNRGNTWNGQPTGPGYTYVGDPSKDKAGGNGAGQITGLGLNNERPDGSSFQVPPASGMGATLEPEYKANPNLVTPKDVTGKPTEEFKMDGTARSYTLLGQGITTMNAGILQEQDAAIDFLENAKKVLAENREQMDQQDQKGPEPYLAHMIGQNDTIIQVAQLQLRAQRAMEERAQMEQRRQQMRDDLLTNYQNDATQSGAISEVLSAARND